MGSAPLLGGAFGHFYAYAPEKLEYPINRYAMEVKRQLDVLDRNLSSRRYLCGDDYNIADMANFAWYGVPDTTSYWANYDDPTQGAALRARNDRLIPLWAASGWIAPCVCVLALRTASVVPASWTAWLDFCLTCSAHVVQTDTWPTAFLRRSSGSTFMLVCERRSGALVRVLSSMHVGEVARRWR